MLSGFNTDIRFEGVTYHIQSEDRGRGHMVVETLVYCGGAILHQVRTPYAVVLRQGGGEAEIARVLERQHRDIVRRVRHGEFQPASTQCLDPAGPEPPGLEGVMAGAAAGDPELQWLELEWQAGRKDPGLFGKLQVRALPGGEPAEGVRVTVRLVGRGLDPLDLVSGQTDERGVLEVAAPLPPRTTGVVFRAEKGAGGGRLRLSV